MESEETIRKSILEKAAKINEQQPVFITEDPLQYEICQELLDEKLIQGIDEGHYVFTLMGIRDAGRKELKSFHPFWRIVSFMKEMMFWLWSIVLYLLGLVTPWALNRLFPPS